MIDLVAIWQKIKKLITKKDLLIIFLLLLLFLITRLYQLKQLPIFTDEAIYIHWAKLAWKDATWRFVSLTDGRQPLQTWATIPLLKVIADPLLAGRLFGVFSGLFALTGVFGLICYLFGKKWAYIGTVVYLINPYYLFYDRMALADSSINGFFIWALFLSLLLIKFPRLDLALIYGLLAGLGTLAKSTMRVFFLPQLLAPFIFFWGKKKWFRKTANFLFLLLIVVGLSMVIYNVQRLSPYMHFIEQKNTTFVLTLSEYLKSPFNPLLHNLYTLPYYFMSESGYLMVLLGLVGLFFLFKKNFRLATYLILFFLIPYLLLSAFARVVFPRYLIFLTIPFFIGFIYLLKISRYRWIIFILYLISISYLLYTIFFAWSKTPFPAIDRGQYIEGASAGPGTKQIVNFLQKQTEKHEKIYVFTEGTFGLLPYSLSIYFPHYEAKAQFEARWPIKPEDFKYAKNLSKDYLVYFVFHEREDFPKEWPLKLIKKYPRPGGQTTVYLFSFEETSLE